MKHNAKFNNIFFTNELLKNKLIHGRHIKKKYFLIFTQTINFKIIFRKIILFFKNSNFRKELSLCIFVTIIFVIFSNFITITPLLGLSTIKNINSKNVKEENMQNLNFNSIFLDIEDSDSNQIITNKLVSNKIVDENTVLVEEIINSNTHLIHPGIYQMNAHMSIKDALFALIGDSKKVYYAAIKRNLRQDETLDILSKSTNLPIKDFKFFSKRPSDFGLPSYVKNLEGYLSPGEYRFNITKSPKEILQDMINRTRIILHKFGIYDQEKQYKILTLASIIEFEGIEGDYKKISGVIMNRLNKPNTETNGLIQSDAAVAYGLNRRSYELTLEEKFDKSNLYNTYAYPGLPPGPIGSPSIKAIHAAIYPDKIPYYYWVTINLRTGETKFSRTLREHTINVENYVRWCKENPGQCL